MDEIGEIEQRIRDFLAVIPDKHLTLALWRDIRRLIELARPRA